MNSYEGSMTIDGNSYRLDNTTTDEIVIVLNFVDTFSGEEKIKIGNAIFEAVKNVFLDRGQLIESPELLEGKE